MIRRARRGRLAALLPLAVWSLTGMSCQVGSAKNPAGTGHESYEETWAPSAVTPANPTGAPVMTGCKLTNDSGIEAQGITTDWRPCGRKFTTGITGLSAFPGQAIGAAEANAAQQNFAAGFASGLGALLPVACGAAGAFAGVPWLAALCGVPQPPPKPGPVAPLASPRPVALESSEP